MVNTLDKEVKTSPAKDSFRPTSENGDNIRDINIGTVKMSFWVPKEVCTFVLKKVFSEKYMYINQIFKKLPSLRISYILRKEKNTNKERGKKYEDKKDRKYNPPNLCGEPSPRREDM